MGPSAEEPILVGQVTRPHGIRGEVVVTLQSENPERFASGVELMVGKDIASATPRKVAGSRPGSKGLLVAFEGVGDRNEAEMLRGQLIFVEASRLESAGKDSWWEHQLLGAEVFSEDGRLVGKVSGILSRLEQDIWEIDTPAGTVQFPAAKDLVISVDLDNNRITVRVPEGLIDED